MAIAECGTFDYVTIVPDQSEDRLSGWIVRLRRPIEFRGNRLFDSRLVGHSPRLQITEAGPTPNPGPGRPDVLRTRFTLVASEQDHAVISSASWSVDKDLASALHPGDALNMSRSGCGGLGLSAIRHGELIFAVGAVTSVPLGNRFEAAIPFDLIERAEAGFKRRDPEFTFRELPVELGSGGDRRITYGGRSKLGDYEVWVRHGFYTGLPGTNESVSIAKIGGCSSCAANASLELLLADNFEMSSGSFTQGG